MELLTEAIDAGAAPGAVAVAGTGDAVTFEQAAGRLSYDAAAAPVTGDTIYDLASLTKVVVTTPLIMRLYERGQLDIDAPVRTYLPEFTGGDKRRVTVADLLAHCGGLLWWTDLYKQFSGHPPEQIEGPIGDNSRDNAPRQSPHWPAERIKRCFVDRICALPLNYAPRRKTVYSDLGFILLGAVLERLTGQSLDRLAAVEIFAPLGMDDIRYNPTATLRPRIAPTEEDPRRGGVLRGAVHDENAFEMGGVAPHAGLFATARSLVPFAQMLLNGGEAGGHRLFRGATVQRFTRRAYLASGSSRALGWDTPAAGGSCGIRFSASSFGHTGFTGTSLWIDPARDLFAILLTNRVHPTRDNARLAALRPAFHDALVEHLAR